MVDDISLYDLAYNYLQKYGKVSKDLSIFKPQIRNAIKFVVKIKNHMLGVWILDWKRSVGTDKLIHIERLVQKAKPKLSGGFVITNKFSPNARELAQQTDSLILIEKAEILYHT